MAQQITEKKSQRSLKNNIGLALAVIILIAMNFFPTSELLTVAGRNSLGLLIAVIVILLTGALPTGVMCMLVIPLTYLLKCVPAATGGLAGFQNQSVFFMLASFGLTCAVTKVPLSKRMMRWIITNFGKSTTSVMLAIMITCALLSAIVSNIAATSAFIPLVVGFLNVFENEEDKKRTGRAMMIGLPVAAMIGGMITPAGGAVNVIAISYIQNLANLNVDFLSWMVIFAPVAIITFPVAFFIIKKVYKPAEISTELIQNYLGQLDIPEKLTKEEVRVAVIVLAMLVCWILGTWFPVFNIMIVAMIGVGVLMLPGIGVFGWKDFLKEANWTAFFMLGTMVGLTGLLRTNGVVTWMSSVLDLSGFAINPYIFAFVIAVVGFLLLIIMPVGPSLVSAFSAPLAVIAAAVGINPAILICVLVMCATCCFLFPIDVVPLLTYGQGYYTVADMPKSTAFIQAFLAVISAVWMPFAIMLLF